MMADFAKLFGYEDVTRIEGWRGSFGATWAHQTPALVLLLCLGVAALSYWFYLHGQTPGRRSIRLALAALRAALLGLIIVILADPLLEVTLTSRLKPVLWLLFDGSDSMAISDKLTAADAAKLESAVGWKQFVAQHPRESSEGPQRADYLRALLADPDRNLLGRLSEQFQLQAFTFDGSDGVRSLMMTSDAAAAATIPSAAGDRLASAWKTEGTFTALGDALNDLAVRDASANLAGVIIFSDFEQNSGAAPLPAARRLGVPLFTVGVGPLDAVDLIVDLLLPPTLKQSEESTISVTVRQRGADARPVEVRLMVRRPAQSETDPSPEVPLGAKKVTLSDGTASVEFPFTPAETGRLIFSAEVDAIDGETVLENNRAERQVNVIDDFLRLLYVEYEPTWEWRFIKEVFHRDKLVGLRGFRTFLRSADPAVRETNELFLPGLTPPRSEFFQFDVLFLGDMPASALSPRFCEMTKEFVSQFGGGLVVLAGPRFGPAELASTPLADMLPVVLDPDASRKDDQEFRLSLTPLAPQYDFMRLGRSAERDPLEAWRHLGKLPWYQPVLRPEARSTSVLAEHPTDLCADGKTKQPLIAVRKYGRGEVVYLGFNEMWRLRRLYGAEHYRQFWGQMIYRLGLSHALGGQKRFVVRTDKQKYRAGEQALVTVEAYDRDFQPLEESTLPDRRLSAEFIAPKTGGGSEPVRSMTLAALRQGVFEARVPVSSMGEHRIRVTDPVNQETAEVSFEVSELSLERRSAVRNIALQRTLAAETGGKDYDLTDVSRLPDEFHPAPRQEKKVEIIPLWSNWLSFAVVISLMMLEWFARKLVNLA